MYITEFCPFFLLPGIMPHYHPDEPDGLTYGFCVSMFNSTDKIVSKCTGRFLTYMPTIEFSLEGAFALWTLIRNPPESPHTMELIYNATNLKRYFVVAYSGMTENWAWHVCNVPLWLVTQQSCSIMTIVVWYYMGAWLCKWVCYTYMLIPLVLYPHTLSMHLWLFI